MRRNGAGKKREVDPRTSNTPDFSMICMLAGAACKFVELGVVREGIPRYQFATLGGILILIGSATVTLNSLIAIYLHLRGQKPDVGTVEASAS